MCCNDETFSFKLGVICIMMVDSFLSNFKQTLGLLPVIINFFL